MYAAAFIGDKIIDLAGWDQGQGAETSNLSMSNNYNFQNVSYIGGTYGRQFFRSGTMTSCSFSSRFELPDYDPNQYNRWVTYFIQSMPRLLSNQSGCVVRLTQPYPTGMGIRQVETITGIGTTVGASVIRVSLFSYGNVYNPINFDINLESGWTSSTWMNYVRFYFKTTPEIQMQFSVSGTGSEMILTHRSPYAAQDNSLYIVIQQLSGTGITATNSINTTSAVSWIPMSELTFYDANVNVATTQVGTSVLLNTSVTGRLIAP